MFYHFFFFFWGLKKKRGTIKEKRNKKGHKAERWDLKYSIKNMNKRVRWNLYIKLFSNGQDGDVEKFKM